MYGKSTLEEECHRILEEKGRRIADRARTILLKEKSLIELQSPLKYISENWRDPATPSFVILSCEAVGGRPDKATHQAALAMTLMSLAFTVWDDLIDRTMHKGFIPTVYGKFGEGVALVTGGLASAKAFSILSTMRVNETKRRKITKLVWDYCETMANAEGINLELRRRSDAKPEEKLKVIELEAVGLETLSKIGAILGNGSDEDIAHLGNYGRYLSMILDLKRDFKVSINLTIELAEKVRIGNLPYTLLWARDRSKKVREYLSSLTDNIEPIDIKEIVKAVLEARVIEHIGESLKELTKKGEAELSDLKNKEVGGRLGFFLAAQSKIFTESLLALQSHVS